MRRFILCVCTLSLLAISGPSTAQTEVPVRRALNITLPELKFDNISLFDALEFLRDVSGANIHVNWKAMELAGIGRDATVNVRLRGVQLRKVLRLVLAEASSGNLLTYYIDGNVIEITTRELADQQLFTKVYPVDDLLVEVPDFDQPPSFNLSQATPTGRGGGGGGSLFGGAVQQTGAGQNTRAQRAEQLIETITSTVQPDVWTAGRAAIRFFNGSLIVTAPRSVHEALGGFSD